MQVPIPDPTPEMIDYLRRGPSQENVSRADDAYTTGIALLAVLCPESTKDHPHFNLHHVGLRIIPVLEELAGVMVYDELVTVGFRLARHYYLGGRPPSSGSWELPDELTNATEGL